MGRHFLGSAQALHCPLQHWGHPLLPSPGPEMSCSGAGHSSGPFSPGPDVQLAEARAEAVGFLGLPCRSPLFPSLWHRAGLLGPPAVTRPQGSLPAREHSWEWGGCPTCPHDSS